MEIKDFNPEQFADLFETGAAPQGPPKFGMEETNLDLFSSTTDTTTLPLSTTDTTTLPAGTVTDDQPLDDVDILSTDDEGKDKDPETVEAPTLSSYIKDRIEAGKFVAIQEQGDDGTTRPFLPQTPEEVDEVIEMQINYQVEQRAKDLEQQFYQSKSPAWRAVFKYAELVDDPTEIMPFLQGVNTIQNVAEIKEDDIDGAEQIVRISLQKTGQPKEFIDTQVDALKTTNKLLEQAKKLKPVILQEETQRLAAIQQEETRRLEEYRTMVLDIRDNAIKAIDAPFGKQVLKNEEKAAVYELIAMPNEQTQGYPIYNKIDELFEKKDFETLRQVALLLTKKDSFINYLTADAKQDTSGKLQRKLVFSTEKPVSSDPTVTAPPVIQRQSPSQPARKGFGRY